MTRPTQTDAAAQGPLDPLAAVYPMFSSVLDGLQLALVVIDRDHRIVLANKHLYDWTKRLPEQTLGDRCHRVFHNRDEVCSDCPAAITFQTGEGARTVHTGLDSEGGTIYAELTTFPIRDESGVIRYALESARDVSERTRFERELLDKNRRLAILNAVASAVGSSLDLDQVLQQALDSVQELMGLRPMGGIFLLDETQGELHLEVHRGLSAEFVRQERVVPVVECLCGLAAQTGQLLHSTDSTSDARHSRLSHADAHAHIIVPLKSRNRVQGVMFLYPPADYRLDPSDDTLFEMVGSQIGVAIENARLYRATDEQLQARVGELIAALRSLEAQSRAILAQGEELRAQNEQLRATNEALVEAERALADSREVLLTQLKQFGAIFDSINAVVYVADMQTYELLFMNSYAAKVYGEDCVGQPCFQRLQGQDGPCSFCTNHLLVRDGIVQPPCIWEFQGRSGRWALCIDEAIRWIDGRLVRMEIAVDVSDRKRAEQMKEDYVRAISHDLRNPLTVIQGQAQVLEMVSSASNLKDHVQRSAMAIVAATRAMNRMIEDMVDTVRLESGQLKLNAKPTDLAAFVADLVQRMSGVDDADRIVLKLPAATRPVLADTDRVERILMNLLNNALKYGAAKTPVGISIEELGGEAVVAISDRGKGIPPEELPHVFEQYFRGKDVRARREGLGLGLYITRALVETHGGRIWAESEPGKGSTFYFTLPVQQRAN